jgi:hypothetical protein
MAQTTKAMSGAAFTIAIQTGGAGAYTDVSGSSQSIDMPELERLTGEAYTPDADTPIVVFGKQKSFDLKVNVVYTEETAEAYNTLYTAYSTNQLVSLKWVPAGTAVGADSWTTDVTQIYKAQLPNGDASNSDVIVCSFTLKCKSVTRTT